MDTPLFTHLGLNVYISGKEYCNRRIADGHDSDTRVVHIYRTDIPGYSCQAVHYQSFVSANDIQLEYRDGESLKDWNLNLDRLCDQFRGSDPLLIHCTVGQTRSPTLAIVALIARGMLPFEASQQVLRCNWQQRKMVSNLCLTPMEEIFRWWDAR